jgi:hypothetical protein
LPKLFFYLRRIFWGGKCKVKLNQNSSTNDVCSKNKIKGIDQTKCRFNLIFSHRQGSLSLRFLNYPALFSAYVLYCID